MQIEQDGCLVRISGVKELGAGNNHAVRRQLTNALEPTHSSIQFDMSETTFVDSCGLGVLVAFHKEALKRNGRFEILNPTPPVQQILELTRLHRVFNVVAGAAAQKGGAAAQDLESVRAH